DQLDVSAGTAGGKIQRDERNYDFQKVIVECAEELGAEKSKKTGVSERIAVFAVGHFDPQITSVQFLRQVQNSKNKLWPISLGCSRCSEFNTHEYNNKQSQ